MKKIFRCCFFVPGPFLTYCYERKGKAGFAIGREKLAGDPASPPPIRTRNTTTETAGAEMLFRDASGQIVRPDPEKKAGFVGQMLLFAVRKVGSDTKNMVREQKNRFF